MKSSGDYFELVVAGLGGQGALIIGQLLAEAGASRYEHVSYFPNYGATMRGGDSECTVVLSHREIGAPAMLHPSAAIIMGAAPLEEFEKRMQPGAMVIVDSSLMPGKVSRPDLKAFYLPATETAIRLGNRQVANFVLLGAYIGATGALPVELVERALERRLAGGRREALLSLNKKALRAGARLVRES